MCTPLLLSAYGVRAGYSTEHNRERGSYSIFTPLLPYCYLTLLPYSYPTAHVQEAVEAGFSSATVSRESFSGVLDL